MTDVRVGMDVPEQDITHDISLAGDGEKWGLLLDGKARGIQEVSATASTILQRGSAGKFGGYGPMFGDIKQETWHGGRGLEEFPDDPTRFFDSKNAWTLTPGRLCPAPMFSFAVGTNLHDYYWPGMANYDVSVDVAWVALRGNQKYLARQFTSASAGYSQAGTAFWIRRIGKPAGTLTVKLYSDTGSDAPNAAQTNAVGTVTTSTITDTLAVLHHFDFTAAFAQGNSTKYWMVIYDSGTGTAANHWEVGYNSTAYTGEPACKQSVDSTPTWVSTTTYRPYFLNYAAQNKRKFHFFYLESGLYLVDEQDDAGASKLYINGDRGIMDGTPTSTSITDSTKSWTADQWINCWVKIHKGTGKGQYRKITDNGTATLTVAALDVTPNTTSEYVIYATDHWTDITPTGGGDNIDGVVTDVATFDNIAIFAEGSGVNMLKMKWASGTPGHLFDDDGTNKGNRVRVSYDHVDGPQVWRAENDTVDISRSDVKAWSTDLSFGTEIDVGDHSYGINRLIVYNNQLWVIKEDSIWSVSNDRASQLNVGIEAAAGPYTGVGACAAGLFLYFGWSQSVERLYGGTLDDIGSWKDAGMPNGRTGYAAVLEPVYSWIFKALDAGPDGTSSILCWDGTGWHEIFRAWKSGWRIRSLKWQHCPFAKPRLWFDCGGDLCFIEFPQDTLNPLHDADMNYNHEFSLETATFTMGAERLPKLFKELDFITEGLGTSADIVVDYKVDDDIGSATSTWKEVTSIRHSPDDSVPLHLGNKRRIRFRIRGRTSDADKPPKIIATVLDCFARTPVKRQWNLRIKISDKQVTKDGAPDHGAAELYKWLLAASGNAQDIFMRANDEVMDEIWVIVEPPNFFRSFINRILKQLGGSVTLTLREA